MLYFFLSYARGDEDELVRQFFGDLSVEVRVRAGLARDAEVGFIDAGMKAGAVWSAELADAVSRCRSFVALLSPRYFQSRPCGQEWQIFADRLARYQREAGVEPAALTPLPWVPLAPGRTHPVAARIPSPFEVLGETSVRQLMRLHRHQDAYRELVFELAGRIVACAETHAVPEGHDYPDLEHTPNIFEAPPPEVDDPLSTVHFVVAAPTRGQALSVRSDRAAYGERPRDWAPYGPAHPAPLVEYAAGVAERHCLAAQVSTVEELAAWPGAEGPVVLLVDAWVTELEEPRRVLAEYDARGPITAVLVPRGAGDRETAAHWRRLSDECRRVFRGTAGDEARYRSGIPTVEAFERELSAALDGAPPADRSR